MKKSPIQTSKSPAYKIPPRKSPALARKSPASIKPLTLLKSSSRKSVSPRLEPITNRLTMQKPSLNFKRETAPTVLQKSLPVSKNSSARKSDIKRSDNSAVLQTSISQANRVLHLSRDFENPEINLSRVLNRKLKQISIDLTDDQEEDDEAYLAHIAPKISTDSSMITPYGLIELNDITDDSISQE